MGARHGKEIPPERITGGDTATATSTLRMAKLPWLGFPAQCRGRRRGKTYSGDGVPWERAPPFKTGGVHEVGVARQHLLPERKSENICILGVGNRNGKGQKMPRTIHEIWCASSQLSAENVLFSGGSSETRASGIESS